MPDIETKTKTNTAALVGVGFAAIAILAAVGLLTYRSYLSEQRVTLPADTNVSQIINSVDQNTEIDFVETITSDIVNTDYNDGTPFDAVFDGNKLHFVYFSNTNLIYSTWDKNSEPVTTKLDSFSPGETKYSTQIALDNNNQPIILLKINDNYYIKKNKDNKWQGEIQLINDETDHMFIDFKIDRDNNIHIVEGGVKNKLDYYYLENIDQYIDNSLTSVEPTKKVNENYFNSQTNSNTYIDRINLDINNLNKPIVSTIIENYSNETGSSKFNSASGIILNSYIIQKTIPHETYNNLSEINTNDNRSFFYVLSNAETEYDSDYNPYLYIGSDSFGNDNEVFSTLNKLPKDYTDSSSEEVLSFSTQEPNILISNDQDINNDQVLVYNSTYLYNKNIYTPYYLAWSSSPFGESEINIKTFPTYNYSRNFFNRSFLTPAYYQLSRNSAYDDNPTINIPTPFQYSFFDDSNSPNLIYLSSGLDKNGQKKSGINIWYNKTISNSENEVSNLNPIQAKKLINEEIINTVIGNNPFHMRKLNKLKTNLKTLPDTQATILKQFTSEPPVEDRPIGQKGTPIIEEPFK